MLHSNYLHAVPSAVELKLRTSPTSNKPKYSSISFADTQALSFEKKRIQGTAANAGTGCYQSSRAFRSMYFPREVIPSPFFSIAGCVYELWGTCLGITTPG